MRGIHIENHTRNAELAGNARLADNFLKRFKGLLGSKTLPSGKGLIIRPCNSVHTFGMGYPIDVLFINSAGYVLKVAANLRPWRAAMCYGSAYVIELPAGTAASTATVAGDMIKMRIGHDE